MAGDPGSKIKVLIVDDSAIVRKLLTGALSCEPDIEVVGAAPDPYIARDKILALDPDVLTLDIEMPRMDGLTFLEKLSRFHPMPVIVISSLAQSSCEAAIEALRLGAVHVLAKPGGPYSVGDLRIDLPNTVRAAAAARRHARPAPVPAPPAAPLPKSADAPDGFLIAIGASTGGTEAIRRILERFPENVPPLVVAQHIPAKFSAAFAKRLNQVCRFDVKEAENGDLLRPGLALVAPGDFHLLVRRSGGQLRAVVKQGPRVSYQRPSVDVLFESVAATAGASAAGILLTGMGADGAQGMLKMKRAGAYTIAQDEATSVVFGMPREAIELGAVEAVLPLGAIADRALEVSACGNTVHIS
ncbi:MAG: protein-glutamate methylesterase/protein-glutamine glutaminase [Bryobacteraceae bacterium]